MAKKIDLAEIEDLMMNKDYVFLKTDAGYSESTKNSIKDHFALTTKQAQDLKKDPVIIAFIASMNNVELFDSRTTGTPEVRENENEKADLAIEMV